MPPRFQKPRPYLIGLTASVGLVGFYLGLMTLTGGWDYALIQLEEFRWWILSLSVGLGIQTTLFVFIRRAIKGVDKKAANSTLAASGGLSAVSMAVCCLHHVADLVPFLGLPFLAVALQRYQTILFLMALLSNAFGIFMLLRMMARHQLIARDSILRSLTIFFRMQIAKGD